jgi:DNA-binding response OmpR family regulator
MNIRADSGEAPRALVVDDEVALSALVSRYLVSGGFEVAQAEDGAAALEKARSFHPHLVVLDLGLPVIDGFDVCRELRTYSDCYIIMLTARTDELDKVTGLSIGADDYMTKPFSPRELLARAQAMLRRPRADESRVSARLFAVPGLSVDLETHEVHVDGRLVELTPTEFGLLAALNASPDKPMSRRSLIDEVWGLNWVGDEQLVDVHVRNVRRKLGDDATDPRFIRTVRGVGYRIRTGRER